MYDVDEVEGLRRDEEQDLQFSYEGAMPASGAAGTLLSHSWPLLYHRYIITEELQNHKERGIYRGFCREVPSSSAAKLVVSEHSKPSLHSAARFSKHGHLERWNDFKQLKLALAYVCSQCTNPLDMSASQMRGEARLEARSSSSCTGE